MRWKTVTVGFAAVAVSVSTMVGAGALVGTFTEVEPPIPDGNVFGDDINDAGQTVGSAEFSGGNHGFIRAADGTYTELAPLGGDTFSYAAAINNDGDVVGGSGGTALIWEGGGAPTDLGALPGETFMQPEDISDTGWIVGNGHDTDQGWYIDPAVGTVTAMTTVPGTTLTQVRSVNDDGVAVGRARVDGTFEPFTWNVDDGMTLLDEPPGDDGFEPRVINDEGVIVGFTFEFIAPDGVYTPYVLDPVDGYSTLDTVGFDGGIPHGLSDDGWVVGFLENNDDESRQPAAWNLTSGDATAFPVFNDVAFTSELNAVNSSGMAVGISREGDDFERTWVGQISPDPGPTTTTTSTTSTTAPPGTPTSPAARVVTANPNFTG